MKTIDLDSIAAVGATLEEAVGLIDDLVGVIENAIASGDWVGREPEDLLYRAKDFLAVALAETDDYFDGI